MYKLWLHSQQGVRQEPQGSSSVILLLFLQNPATNKASRRRRRRREKGIQRWLIILSQVLQSQFEWKLHHCSPPNGLSVSARSHWEVRNGHVRSREHRSCVLTRGVRLRTAQSDPAPIPAALRLPPLLHQYNLHLAKRRVGGWKDGHRQQQHAADKRSIGGIKIDVRQTNGQWERSCTATGILFIS